MEGILELMPARKAQSKAVSQVNSNKARGRPPKASADQSRTLEKHRPGKVEASDRNKDSKSKPVARTLPASVRETRRRRVEGTVLLELDKKGKAAKPQFGFEAPKVLLKPHTSGDSQARVDKSSHQRPARTQEQEGDQERQSQELVQQVPKLGTSTRGRVGAAKQSAGNQRQQLPATRPARIQTSSQEPALSEDSLSLISYTSSAYERIVRRSLSHPHAFKAEILQDAQDLVSSIRAVSLTEEESQEPPRRAEENFQESQRRAEAIANKFRDFLQTPSSESGDMSSSKEKAPQPRKVAQPGKAGSLNSNTSRLSVSAKADLLEAANIFPVLEKYPPDEHLREQILKDNSVRCNEEKVKRWSMLLKHYNIAEDVVKAVSKQAEVEYSKDTENRWIANLEKSKVSYEAFLQHTIMLKTIDRFRYEDFKDNLDFSVELTWRSPSPPTKPLSSGDSSPRLLWKPTPDLCVGFRPRKIFPKDPYAYKSISLDLKTLVVPEQLASEYDTPRAFPFLFLEVKGSSADAIHKHANNQAANGAAHALYNIWKCVEGNKDLEAEFEKKVRVFSAGAHPKEFWLRIHRAERLPEDSNAIIRKDCPFRFVSEDVMELSGSNFTQIRVQTTLKNIMRWTVKELSGTLEKAATQILKKDKEIWANKSNKNHASPDGQPTPKRRRSGRNKDVILDDTQVAPNLNSTGLSQEVAATIIEDEDEEED